MFVNRIPVARAPCLPHARRQPSPSTAYFKRSFHTYHTCSALLGNDTSDGSNTRTPSFSTLVMAIGFIWYSKLSSNKVANGQSRVLDTAAVFEECHCDSIGAVGRHCRIAVENRSSHARHRNTATAVKHVIAASSKKSGLPTSRTHDCRSITSQPRHHCSKTAVTGSLRLSNHAVTTSSRSSKYNMSDRRMTLRHGRGRRSTT